MSDEAVIKIETTGKVRYARLHFQGKQSSIRIPLELFDDEKGSQPNRQARIGILFQRLHERYETKYGVSAPRARIEQS